jgi:hypothetical protein
MVQTLFPGVSTPGAAERVELSTGGTRTNIDFPLVGASRVSVRGQLVHPDEARLATGSVSMSPASNGVFEFSNVPPGRYHLRASARTSI